ncbi:TonB family protein [Terricaulis sp.]|uniref:TonB family protein n=1 Tax=Terricaulis sp. TaxID=2768686 RepID=UPI0037837BFC
MSDKPHGATTIHASKGGGGGGKWLLGAVAAAIVIGGGYYAYTTMAPSQSQTVSDLAYNEPYGADEGVRAGPLEEQSRIAETATADESAEAAPAATRTATPRRTAAVQATEVPEETIGITPVSAVVNDTGETNSDEIVVTAPRRPVWSQTPTARRLSALYPERALSRGREGEARLHCVVQDGGALGCETVSATPGGFGNAALRVARTFRHAPQLSDGSDAVGSPVNLRVVFQIADEPHRG